MTTTAPLTPRHCAQQPPPRGPSPLPPRQTVPEFRPIRRGGGGRDRLQQAVRQRPGVLVTGLLAAATAIAAGPLRPGAPTPTGPAGPQSPPAQTAVARCSAGR
ncbi:hypothetical protein ABH930_003236 [Kitasatospora sp. GAS204A]|uniref:hypothetical protein n=1 Tax=unclassified Kitasatospora TaxID=2633591 RepID=UPI002476EE02|nr:hypothetical protein [Kitasatospora sp. GAS204B]MDH6117997.1 hypothetical protein [Kitasatospora sp. GAS204B]